MKWNIKISGRERWLLAFAPSVAIVAIYLYGFSDNLAGELARQEKRIAAAKVPLPPPPPAAALTKAKANLEETNKGIADKEHHIASLRDAIAAAAKTASSDQEDSAPARVIEKVEAVFARNGITPIVSEPASQNPSGNQPPAALVALLAPKPGDAAIHADPRVWHCIFEGSTSRFERAVKALREETPKVVPLSLNLVYNPADDGETRLLELWLVY